MLLAESPWRGVVTYRPSDDGRRRLAVAAVASSRCKKQNKACRDQMSSRQGVSVQGPRMSVACNHGTDPEFMLHVSFQSKTFGWTERAHIITPPRLFFRRPPWRDCPSAEAASGGKRQQLRQRQHGGMGGEGGLFPSVEIFPMGPTAERTELHWPPREFPAQRVRSTPLHDRLTSWEMSGFRQLWHIFILV